MQQVDLTIEDDESRSGGGFARLLFDLQAPSVPANLTVSFKRGGEQEPWLGPGGWQASEHLFRPVSAEALRDGLSLVVGPEVVNQIEAFTSVMAHLPDLEVFGLATWEATPGFAVRSPPAPEPEPVEVPFQLLPGGAIAFQLPPEDLGSNAPPARLDPSGSHLGVAYEELRRAFQGRLQIDPRSGEARLLKGPGKPPRLIAFSASGSGGLLLKGEEGHPYKATVGPGESLFGLDSGPLAERKEGLVELDPETLKARLVEPTVTPTPPPLPKRNPLAWLLPLIVFLLVAVGTAGALYLKEAETQKEEEEKKSAQKEEEKEEEKTPPPPLTPAQLYDKGAAAMQAKRYDEARPLLRQAEHGGNREAALLLAQAVDSLDFETGLFAAADDVEALRLYGKACEPGEDPKRTEVVASAKEALAALGTTLKEKADQGDIVAADVLRGPFKEAEEQCQ